MTNITQLTLQILTTIWAVLVGSLVFTGMNLAAIIALPFPKALREKIFYIPSPFLMKALFHIGFLSKVTKIDHRSPSEIKNQKGKSVLYIANHSSMIDPPFLNSAYPITTLMKFEVLYIPFLTLPSFACGAITVKRGDKNSRKSALLKSVTRLKTSQPVFYFPEGTRSKDKSIKEFSEIHLPLLKAAYQEGVCVLPISILGTRQLLSKFNLIRPFHPMTMVTHDYVHPKDFSDELEFCKKCWEKVEQGLTEES